MTDQELRQNFQQLTVALQQVSERLDRVDRRFEQIDQRFEQIDRRFEQIDQRFEETIEFARGIETSLLKEFRKWAISFESRHKANEILVGGFNERLIALEERVGDIERRASNGHAYNPIPYRPVSASTKSAAKCRAKSRRRRLECPGAEPGA